MKGVIPKCLAEMVVEKFGRESWEKILSESGLDRSTSFFPTEDIDDTKVLTVVRTTCEVLGITVSQAADAFGEYWINVFAPKIYHTYYRKASSAKEFLMKMDRVHEMTTQNIENARPPRFDYEWRDDSTLVMTYNSSRGLIDFFIGLIKGVGTYFKEDLKVERIGADKVKIRFA